MRGHITPGGEGSRRTATGHRWVCTLVLVYGPSIGFPWVRSADTCVAQRSDVDPTSHTYVHLLVDVLVVVCLMGRPWGFSQMVTQVARTPRPAQSGCGHIRLQTLNHVAHTSRRNKLGRLLAPCRLSLLLCSTCPREVSDGHIVPGGGREALFARVKEHGKNIICSRLIYLTQYVKLRLREL